MPTPPPVGIGIIFCVKKSDDGTIAKVGVQPLWHVPPICMTRDEALRELRAGSAFQTIFREENGRWLIGAAVDIVRVSGKEFLRTDHNETPSDNLGELDECTDC